MCGFAWGKQIPHPRDREGTQCPTLGIEKVNKCPPVLPKRGDLHRWN